MKIATFTKEELTTFTSFVRNLAENMVIVKKTEVETKKGKVMKNTYSKLPTYHKLYNLVNKFDSSRAVVDISFEERAASVGVIKTALSTLNSDNTEVPEDKKDYFIKVKAELLSMEAKLLQ